ncbi:M20 peptidase aminoacylase family protein [Rummeliibacillus pycnus]|uniref:M20 peptidase aminoacylase family protein n=1 Tax=Rummeliibacillus pycnus TaxID=101070 RepID=UPI0037C7D3D5
MKQLLEEITPKLKEVFSYLHNHPEISWHEYNTTAYLQRLLESYGFEPHLLVESTGLYVEIGSGKPVIGLRTDIDALWQEVDGKFQANHSCGHDGHMTMAIGTLLLLQKLYTPEDAMIRVLFQPAEEKGQGALHFIEQGLVDDIDYLFGVHVRPIQELQDGTFSPAIYHGAARLITGTIYGREAHGARPHLGKNAIEIGASLVNALQSIHIDPLIPSSIKLTKFQAGSAANVIPGKAEFSIDVRSQKNEGINALMNAFQNAIRGVESQYNIEIDYQIEANIAAAEVDEDAMQLMRQAIVDTVGEANTKPPIVTPGGEDFHFYTLKCPNIKATMLGLGCGLQPGLHHPKMTFNREALITGVEILTRTVLNAVAYAKKEVTCNDNV